MQGGPWDRAHRAALGRRRVPARAAPGSSSRARPWTCATGESTPLHSAAGSGQLEVVHELLRRGADAKAQDDSGVTAADLAQSRGHATVAEAVREGGSGGGGGADAAGPTEATSAPAGSATYAY